MSKDPKKSKDPKNERRQYLRIEKGFILKYYDLKQPEEKFEITQLKNISLGGMCFVTTQSFAPSTQLGIDLNTPYLSGATYLQGVVLESHEKMKNRIYETRLQFKSLETEARVLLEKLIEVFTD